MAKAGFFDNFKEILGMKASEGEEEQVVEEKVEEQEVEEKVENQEIAKEKEITKEKEEESRENEVNPLSFENNPRKKTYESDEELEDSQTIFVKPIGFEECKKIANYINQEKMVTINLEELNNEEAQRLLDFLSGAMEVKKARFIPVSKKVYASVPDGTKSYIENEPREIFG